MQAGSQYFFDAQRAIGERELWRTPLGPVRGEGLPVTDAPTALTLSADSDGTALLHLSDPQSPGSLLQLAVRSSDPDLVRISTRTGSDRQLHLQTGSIPGNAIVTCTVYDPDGHSRTTTSQVLISDDTPGRRLQVRVDPDRRFQTRVDGATPVDMPTSSRVTIGDDRHLGCVDPAADG